MFGFLRRQESQSTGRAATSYTRTQRAAELELERRQRLERFQRFLQEQGRPVALYRPAPNPEIRWID